MANIVIVQGHPDAGAGHLLEALANAYGEGAREAGHEVKHIRVAELPLTFLRSREEWEQGQPADYISQSQELITWAEQLVICYPLWHGTMPAMLKAFLEQILRPGFALDYSSKGFPRRMLSGKRARVVVTMGMPVFAYRWFFRAHSLKSLERNILKFCGIRPVRESLFGGVESAGDKQRQRWIDGMRILGRTAA